MIKAESYYSIWGKLALLALPIMIVLGTILLALPIARTAPIALIDLFFTATSASCVCGLLTIDLHQFTLFGQHVIFWLMQLGGLGIITLSLMFIFIMAEVKMSTQSIAEDILEIHRIKDIKKILLFILGLTIATECFGALVTFLNIYKYYPLSKAIFYAFFHATASFCNAGISIFPNGDASFNQNLTMLSVTGFLIFVGGLGFITWHEKFNALRGYFTGQKTRISLNSRIALSASICLILGGALLFWCLEHNNTLKYDDFLTSITNSLFNAISVRSAGFLTVNIHALRLSTILLILILCFIGSAPGSTGSGIKTSTLVIFLATTRAVISGRSSIEIGGRTIPQTQVYKAMTIIVLSLSWIAFTAFCLLITESDADFLSVIFEATSAFAVLGLSLGLTAKLSFIGKIFILLSMLFGRIGSLTLILVLLKKRETKDFSLPEERVMLS